MREIERNRDARHAVRREPLRATARSAAGTSGRGRRARRRASSMRGSSELPLDRQAEVADAHVEQLLVRQVRPVRARMRRGLDAARRTGFVGAGHDVDGRRARARTGDVRSSRMSIIRHRAVGYDFGMSAPGFREQRRMPPSSVDAEPAAAVCGPARVCRSRRPPPALADGHVDACGKADRERAESDARPAPATARRRQAQARPRRSRRARRPTSGYQTTSSCRRRRPKQEL